jgi:hypothetical protein
VGLPSVISRRAPFARFLLCAVVIIGLQFLLLAIWFALQNEVLAGFAFRFRDGLTLAKLYFVGFQYLAISLAATLFAARGLWLAMIPRMPEATR